MLNPQQVLKDFPILQRIHPGTGKRIVYLDSAATSQKPQAVLDAIVQYYTHSNANVHRGIHLLSEESTELFENARTTIAHFFGASPDALLVTRNTTEAINAVVYGWGERHIGVGDRVLVSLLEHHSNFVPWQQLCQRTGATLEVIPVTADGQIDLAWLATHAHNSVKVICVSHVSNVLGSVLDVPAVVKIAKKVGAKVVLDAAQSVPHMAVNFDQLEIDFLAFSGHKMLGPMGIGGLLVKSELLSSGEFQPWLFGGGMIAQVSPEQTEFSPDIAERFTAGTPDVASLVGLAASVQYLHQLTMSQVESHDQSLVAYALDQLSQNSSVTVLGPVGHTKSSQVTSRLGSVTFLYKGVHAHDVAAVLESQGIAVRSGHHCAMPLHTHFGWPATVRASFNVYSSTDDIDALLLGLEKVKAVFNQ